MEIILGCISKLFDGEAVGLSIDIIDGSMVGYNMSVVEGLVVGYVVEVVRITFGDTVGIHEGMDVILMVERNAKEEFETIVGLPVDEFKVGVKVGPGANRSVCLNVG